MAMIMVVDDDVDITVLVKALLEDEGYNVIVFNKAKDALVSLKKGTSPDLLLLDMRMVDMSGQDFIDALEADEKMKGIRVVIFTASVDIATLGCKKGPVVGCMAKPFDNALFVKRIKRFLK